MIYGHQYLVRSMIHDLEAHHGPAAVWPITQHLSRADEELRKHYQALAAESEKGKDTGR